MPRRERPPKTERSEHWLRVAVNEHTDAFNSSIAGLFGWDARDPIEWRSPIEADDYAEYFDDEFIDRLCVSDLLVPLIDFWPRSGPRWDGLGRTKTGKLILVEAKAYIEEAVVIAAEPRRNLSRQSSRRLLRQRKPLVQILTHLGKPHFINTQTA